MSRAMKDSGVPWIGSIPQNWETAPIKSAVAWKSVKGHGQATVLSLYRDYGVVPKDSRDDNHNVTSTETDAYKFVEKGDLVINKMKAWQGSMAISQFEGIVSPAYHVASLTNENVYAPYFNYLIRDVSYLPEYTRLSTGMRIGQWDLAFDDFIRIPFLLPPLEEQQRIADFLDAQAQEVDAAIVKTQESIEEYKKLKQAVITQAVTKGIRPNRPMKDSGVEWIGEMPAEWELRKLKYAVSVRKETRQYFPCSGTYIGLENLESLGSGIIPSESQYDEGEYAACETGDILYSKLRPYLCKCIVNTMNACCTGEFLVIKSFDGAKKYLRYYLLNTEWTKNVTASTYGAKMPRANSTFILDQMCFIPCLAEQQEIVAYLDERCGAIDEMIEKKQQIVTELESYKKSLIYEYVTGKKEVPA